MHDERLLALRTCVQAVISLAGGHIYSMEQLARTVTKCSRFLFAKEAMYHGDMADEVTALEARIVIELAGEIVKKERHNHKVKQQAQDFDEFEIESQASIDRMKKQTVDDLPHADASEVRRRF